MRYVHETTAQVQRRRYHEIDAQHVQPDHGAGDVHDRIYTANLVEMHLLDINAMNGCLGLTQPREDRARALLDPRR